MPGMDGMRRRDGSPSWRRSVVVLISIDDLADVRCPVRPPTCARRACRSLPCAHLGPPRTPRRDRSQPPGRYGGAAVDRRPHPWYGGRFDLASERSDPVSHIRQAGARADRSPGAPPPSSGMLNRSSPGVPPSTPYDDAARRRGVLGHVCSACERQK